MKEFLDSWPGALCALGLLSIFIAPELGAPLLLCLLLWALWKTLGYSWRAAKATGSAVVQSIEEQRRQREWETYLASVSPPTVEKPPTRDELYREILRRHDANCDLIRSSPLDEATKAEAIAEEKRTLEHRIKQLLE